MKGRILPVKLNAPHWEWLALQKNKSGTTYAESIRRAIDAEIAKSEGK